MVFNTTLLIIHEFMRKSIARGEIIEKYSGYDELVQVPTILSIDELMEIWYFVNKIPYYYIRELSEVTNIATISASRMLLLNKVKM